MKAQLIKLQAALKDFRALLNKNESAIVAKATLREAANSLSTTWFETVSGQVASSGICANETLDNYNSNFKTLLKLSSGPNRKTTYESILKAILSKFSDDLVIPSQTKPIATASNGHFSAILGSLPENDEKQYLTEAISCAKGTLYRAAVVMGWCAAINRIHRKLENIGFQTFNSTSAMMKSQTQGRFKRFDKVYSINSMSELREVFDTDIIWIIEGMQLIDSNQHTRLRSCFEMRCQCAHPGEAPISEYNLMSFFSDIKLIVFENVKLAIS